MQIRIANREDLLLLNNIMQHSKAYWGYDADFMRKFMGLFQLKLEYIDQHKTFIASIDGGISWGKPS